MTKDSTGVDTAEDRSDAESPETTGTAETGQAEEPVDTGESDATAGDADADSTDSAHSTVGAGDAGKGEGGAEEEAAPAGRAFSAPDGADGADRGGAGQAGKEAEQATTALKLPAPRDPRVPMAAESGPEPEEDEDEDSEEASGQADGEAAEASEEEPGEKPRGEAGQPEEDDGEGDGRPVDQPTAMFALPGKRVDQPTTALRVPADTAEEPPADRKTTSLRLPSSATGEEGAPEEADEPPADRRTTSLRLPPSATGTTEPPASTYVPLKSADAPAEEPKDPLELLAALTNRPPPPPTPLRTAARRVKIWTPVVLLLVIAVAVAQFLRPLPDPELRLTAAETFTFDGGAPDVPWPSSGQAHLEVAGIGSFGSSGAQEPTPIASVAKVMTAYIILRDHPITDEAGLGELIPIDQQAEEDSGLSAQNESTVDVQAGDEITEYEAIQSLLIASANNVARLLARWDAGSEEAFVEKMNETARELGMENTTYTDPSGLEDTTVSTAADQVILGEAAMRDGIFREIARQPSYTDMYDELHYNWNGLVPMNHVVGIKTGTTTAAGGNLLFAVEQPVGEDEHRLIVGAVVDQDPLNNSILDGAIAASDTLIRFAQEQLRTETILSAGDVVGYVDDGLGGRTPVAVTEDVTAVGWDGMSVDLTLTPAEDGVPGSAAAGTEVGTLTVAGTEVPVALVGDLAEPAVGERLTRVA
ncbi:D-alanyl-D-alanine carboxypeptidase [Streptomyces sp. MS19]|uniref:D-alanyl-D-alanine carboxypeptidase n=1 Tax=Streptomyces sp. MS19 TaxID=3385972 RepID=UPI0039A00FC3